MATIKHLSSKNSDLGAAERYLIFQHDESNNKPILDAHAGKDLHAEYLKLPKKKQEKFYEENRPALMLYDVAMRYFKENGVKTIPTVKRIQDEIEDLTSQKNAGYTDYRESQKREKELQTVKANIETILRQQEPEIGQERKTREQEL